ncbi:helix-turn-helix transcriptional regulator [Streptomyces sp. NPDC006798]|uniref:helix-turn-helix domain-containing protein n=1 Tax=Streptomyces sp. NPDC006798 TaxID=3155462 RepID=UPI0033E782CC
MTGPYLAVPPAVPSVTDFTGGPARPGAMVAGAYLRTLRQARYRSPRDAARAAWCTLRTLQLVETGRTDPDDPEALGRIVDHFLPGTDDIAGELLALAGTDGTVLDSTPHWADRIAAVEELAGTMVLASSTTVPAPFRSPMYEAMLRETGNAPHTARALPLTHGKSVALYLHEDAVRHGPTAVVRDQAAHLIAHIHTGATIRIITHRPDHLTDYLPLGAGRVYGQLWLYPIPLYTEETLTHGVHYPDRTSSTVSGRLEICRTRAASRTDSLGLLWALADGAEWASVVPG